MPASIRMTLESDQSIAAGDLLLSKLRLLTCPAGVRPEPPTLNARAGAVSVSHTPP